MKMEEHDHEGKLAEVLAVKYFLYVLVTCIIYIPVLEILNTATTCWLTYT